VTQQTSFRHELLLYTDGDRGFLDGVLAPLQSALQAEAAVLVVVTRERAAALRQALGPAAQSVRFIDVQGQGRNPARTFAAWQDFVHEHAASTPGAALGVSEPVWPGRSAAELSECRRQEALVNLAFAAGPAWRLLCCYDLDGLDESALEAASRTHPLLAGTPTGTTNEHYTCAGEAPQPFAGSLPEPGTAFEVLEFSGDSLGQVRHTLGAWAESQGLDEDGAEELVLAVNEIAANSVRHGGGSGTMRRWRENGTLLCEVQDAGHISAPLTGRVRPAPEAVSGRGVWLANQLCDLVQIRSAPMGSVVRVHKHLPVNGRAQTDR
jgi:anti-sigma regulatory factor (Ser/Thr protein kinase)